MKHDLLLLFHSTPLQSICEPLNQECSSKNPTKMSPPKPMAMGVCVRWKFFNPTHQLNPPKILELYLNDKNSITNMIRLRESNRHLPLPPQNPQLPARTLPGRGAVFRNLPRWVGVLCILLIFYISHPDHDARRGGRRKAGMILSPLQPTPTEAKMARRFLLILTLMAFKTFFCIITPIPPLRPDQESLLLPFAGKPGKNTPSKNNNNKQY